MVPRRARAQRTDAAWQRSILKRDHGASAESGLIRWPANRRDLGDLRGASRSVLRGLLARTA
eukprot:1779045-Prymnesium_polylepis.1